MATEAITQFLMNHEMLIYLVVFSKRSFELSEKLMTNVRSFLDETYVEEKEKAEYSFTVRREFEAVQGLFERECLPCPMMSEPLDTEAGWQESRSVEPVSCSVEEISLADMLKDMDAGFTDTLLHYIDRTGKKDSDIYKKANIDRKHFSKIRNNPCYKPTKATALAFAVALELDLEQTKDFIGRAGYALSRSSKFDVIIEYFIIHGNYDIHEINMMLFEFDQSLLGA